ncbi:hypothetical protein BU23DRAFT_602814 [Bimuria novae-zelandiae CBS 107.79]|uniref:Bacteriophage T5 Orf172 DNA-binding domain-containing protein n=1 Tax=Bimuria novae-zelandiae CBS 107.79 TaxID=1447943 RepID=A0A6A5UQM8_9PLEO|nr:hypothetical protein BU23DRAFT_602814 [Bimuria novae-zelandiae CBS 107.79]
MLVLRTGCDVWYGSSAMFGPGRLDVWYWYMEFGNIHTCLVRQRLHPHTSTLSLQGCPPLHNADVYWLGDMDSAGFIIGRRMLLCAVPQLHVIGREPLALVYAGYRVSIGISQTPSRLRKSSYIVYKLGSRTDPSELNSMETSLRFGKGATRVPSHQERESDYYTKTTNLSRKTPTKSGASDIPVSQGTTAEDLSKMSSSTEFIKPIPEISGSIKVGSSARKSPADHESGAETPAQKKAQGCEHGPEQTKTANIHDTPTRKVKAVGTGHLKTVESNVRTPKTNHHAIDGTTVPVPTGLDDRQQSQFTFRHRSTVPDIDFSFSPNPPKPKTANYSSSRTRKNLTASHDHLPSPKSPTPSPDKAYEANDTADALDDETVLEQSSSDAEGDDSCAYKRIPPSAIARRLKQEIKKGMPGGIYILEAPKFFAKYQPAGKWKAEQWVKIGISSDVDKRVQELLHKCGIDDLVEVKTWHVRKDVAKKAETLCHTQLNNFRRKIIDCKCGKSVKVNNHREWFAVEKDVAIRTVEMWVNFLGQDPHERDGELKSSWRDSLLEEKYRELDRVNTDEAMHQKLAEWIETTAAKMKT